VDADIYYLLSCPTRSRPANERVCCLQRTGEEWSGEDRRLALSHVLVLAHVPLLALMLVGHDTRQHPYEVGVRIKGPWTGARETNK
jgi:hypothetical protein